jgi:transcription antitermination factor NusG
MNESKFKIGDVVKIDSGEFIGRDAKVLDVSPCKVNADDMVVRKRKGAEYTAKDSHIYFVQLTEPKMRTSFEASELK